MVSGVCKVHFADEAVGDCYTDNLSQEVISISKVLDGIAGNGFVWKISNPNITRGDFVTWASMAQSFLDGDMQRCTVAKVYLNCCTKISAHALP